MQRLLFLVMLLPVLSFAQDSTAMSWLDNRFRVDPTVEQVSFVVQREENSRAIVLVRPDGEKYYSWRHPENVAWYDEPGMDIISIEKPMPGPWQAIGNVTPKNQVTVLSDLKLSVDNLPARLYQSETLKFTARLTQNGELLTMRDFLDRVKLSVIFYEFIEDIDSLPKEARPGPIVLGEFADDGMAFDEVPGDGVFTVALPVDIQPGKYRVKISSSNGIFLRTVEQQVLVYPPPLRASFIQGRGQNEPHQVVVETEEGALLPGSLAAHIEQETPEEKVIISQQHAFSDEDGLKVRLPNAKAPGRYAWSGWLYATDNFSERELIFRLPKNHFAVMAELQLDLNLADFRAQQEAKAQLAEMERLAAEREAARSKALKVILGANGLVVILVVVGAFLWRKRKMKKALEEETLIAPTP
ncbi:TIGR03503 family protein [Photobacterium sp. SDRW27]|uniref:TIGR03503 family protein n=1 Tax=Photobacterium obscurum TaxID=2829490 RepID=UPI00224452F0|nr:TIGR03503 family protein [Photobacterium obscurum]MCW8331764.1 TIGR03503 family protein [Photobacterium obscurum]